MKKDSEIDGNQLTNAVIEDLEALLDALRTIRDEGSRAVSHGVRDDTRGEPVLTIWHEDGTEEYAYPGVIDEIDAWLASLPNKPPVQPEPAEGED